MLIFTSTLKITDFHIQCIYSLAFIWWHNPLLFCVNLIKGLLLLSFCTQNFHSISATILFTQGHQGWTLKVSNHYWILNHVSPHKIANMVRETISRLPWLSRTNYFLNWVQPGSAKTTLNSSNVRWALLTQWLSHMVVL